MDTISFKSTGFFSKALKRGDEGDLTLRAKRASKASSTAIACVVIYSVYTASCILTKVTKAIINVFQTNRR